MRNMYPGKCFKCGEQVLQGEGFFQKINKGDGKLYEENKNKRKWVLRCKNCVGTGNQITDHAKQK